MLLSIFWHFRGVRFWQWASVWFQMFWDCLLFRQDFCWTRWRTINFLIEETGYWLSKKRINQNKRLDHWRVEMLHSLSSYRATSIILNLSHNLLSPLTRLANNIANISLTWKVNVSSNTCFPTLYFVSPIGITHIFFFIPMFFNIFSFTLINISHWYCIPTSFFHINYVL